MFQSQHPDVFAIEVFGKYGNDNWQKTFDDYADYVYSNTALLDSSRFNSLCNADQIEQLMKDPAVVHALSVMKNYKGYYEPKVNAFNYEMFELNRAYQGALLEKNKNKQMYPDANSTMRTTYGKVSSYAPKDAIFINYYT
ncbi:MAG: S46 family peptidase [Bacteroidetes bacterium]|nr:S46 family peptidase [Bacteroidota bacterium]